MNPDTGPAVIINGVPPDTKFVVTRPGGRPLRRAPNLYRVWRHYSGHHLFPMVCATSQHYYFTAAELTDFLNSPAQEGHTFTVVTYPSFKDMP